MVATKPWYPCITHVLKKKQRLLLLPKRLPLLRRPRPNRLPALLLLLQVSQPQAPSPLLPLLLPRAARSKHFR